MYLKDGFFKKIMNDGISFKINYCYFELFEIHIIFIRKSSKEKTC